MYAGDTVTDFGVWLRRRVRTLGTNQTGLAAILGISHVTVGRWMREEIVPSDANIVKLARALDVPVSEVFVALGRIPPRESLADLSEEKRILIEYIIDMDAAGTAAFTDLARTIQELREVYKARIVPLPEGSEDEAPTVSIDTSDE